MKILIPTDFSRLSEVAVDYAVKLAKKINAEIILLHVAFISGPPRAQATLKAEQILDAIVENAKQDFARLSKNIKQETGNKIKISYKVIKGYPVENVVETFSQNYDVDLIIIGTKGASGLKKVLMGSNATAVIGNSRIPVITVPEHARFKNIKNIVYASDLLTLNKEIKILIQFASLFNSSIHILHIVSPASKKKINRIQIQNDLRSKFQYPKIFVHISLSDNIEEAIDEYIADVNADILAMFTHKPTVVERIFGKSVTREMAFHSWIPLLAIKKQSKHK